MDGYTSLLRLQELLQEDSTSTFIDTRTSYEYIWEAAQDFVARTGCITGTQDITTVAETSTYDLEPDFMELFLRDSNNEFVVKYYDTSAYTFIKHRAYDAVITSNNTTSTSIPWSFSIRDKRSDATAVTGTTTSDGADSGGECVLTDSTATFTCNPGDMVHNSTDGSHGIVLALTSTTAVVTALFGGTNNDWTSSDAYTIMPQAMKQIILDPPSSTAGHTVTIEYIKRPHPVFSYYRSYRIPPQYMNAVLKYAAWLYKYRDREPSSGDAWYKYYDAQVERAMNSEIKAKAKTSFRVNMKKQAYTDQSYR